MSEPFYQVDPNEKKRDAMLLLYVRVSTAEQASSDRTSMKSQERAGRGYAMMKDIPDFNTVVFKDGGVSGATPVKERPGGIEMLKVARAGDTICASRLDRMFRSALDALQVAQELKKRGIHLVLLDMGDQPVTSNGMAECFFQMAAAFAQLERVRIAERMADGRRAKFEKGGHIGGLPPYGFQKVGKGRAAMLEPNLEEQEVMQRVLNMSRYSTPLQICFTLARAGIKPRCAPSPFVPTCGCGAAFKSNGRCSKCYKRRKPAWQSVQIIRMRQHARRLWPEIAPHKIKGLRHPRPDPREVIKSEDGHHTTLWMPKNYYRKQPDVRSGA